MNDDLTKRIQFIIEIDQLKEIIRHSHLISQSRRENSAEHSWHIALLAITLFETLNKPVDILRVLKMILLHDIVEIDAGDTMVYDDSPEVLKSKRLRESLSASRIFGLLPEKQKLEFIGLWEEFEEEKTEEALYAASLDRIMPLLHNIHSSGLSWKENGITLDQVLEKNKKIAKNLPEIWDYLVPRITKTFVEISGKLPS